MELLIIMAVVCAGIGGLIDGGRGVLLGGALGVFGLIIAAILSGKGAD